METDGKSKRIIFFPASEHGKGAESNARARSPRQAGTEGPILESINQRFLKIASRIGPYVVYLLDDYHHRPTLTIEDFYCYFPKYSNVDIQTVGSIYWLLCHSLAYAYQSSWDGKLSLLYPPNSPVAEGDFQFSVSRFRSQAIQGFTECIYDQDLQDGFAKMRNLPVNEQLGIEIGLFLLAHADEALVIVEKVLNEQSEGHQES